MSAFKLITPPAVEPVTLDEVKAHARVDTAIDDTLITNLITGARQWAEQYTGRAFIAQTWQLWIDRTPSAFEPWWDGIRQGPVTGFGGIGYIPLPRPPLISVTSVQYFDDSDNATTWDASNYYTDAISEPARLALRSGGTWPVPGRLTNGLCIQYSAGYGSDASAVPEVIKTAIRQLVAHWYEHRGEAATASSTRGTIITPTVPVPLVIQALLGPYRLVKV